MLMGCFISSRDFSSTRRSPKAVCSSLTLLLTRHVGNAHLGDSGSNVSHVRGWLVCERGGRGVTVDGIIGREGGTREGRRRRKNQFGRLRRNGFHVKSQRPPPAQSHRIGRAEKLGSYVTPSQLNSLTSSIVGGKSVISDIQPKCKWSFGVKLA